MSMLEVVQRLHQIWNTGDLDAIPTVYAASFVAHMPKGWGTSEFSGHDGVQTLILRIRNAFPDWREEVQDTISTNNRVVTRYTSTGTNTGPLDGRPATGRAVRVDEISIYRIEANLVQEQWCLVDDLSFAKQLGLF